MPTTSRFMNGFLTSGDVQLGRLVLDTAHPQKNFCKSASLDLDESDVSRRVFTNIESLTNATSASSFKLLLSKILEVFAGKSSKSVDAFKTARAISYELRNVNEKFDIQLEDQKVVKWLEKYRSKTPIHMVVALHTLEDAAVTLDTTQSSQIQGKATVPVASALDAVAPGASVLAAPLNIQGEANHSRSLEQSASFIAPGERIIAVGYQRVRFRRFASCTADPLALARKAVWKSFDTSRDGAATDMVEATVDAEGEPELGKGAYVVAESAGYGGTFVILQDQVDKY